MDCVVLTHCVRIWLAVCCHKWVEDVIERHCTIPTNCAWSCCRRSFERVVHVQIKCIIHCMEYVLPCIIVGLGLFELGVDAHKFFLILRD